ncbi:hypothetical protein PQJ75_29020 [Rhodoplanes sp. TEM]|uniref:DUF6869 domain-containing protein n=1 Tax=Rhodoplanes tepidamans TaxID=200616 RepID=A0ABT5JJT6_RHOTP|nr:MULTISPECIES: hypothetical protein [Rhodoplanes]MDC7789973.1 hypothetical protein [Rhodoplanes tepidamans]MDC7987796.1 hypothetical protein [Rhodoplanes sp. TEM]MDQ0353932.1 hypothetical protein [Rhodoplanes tepidamans]
MSFIDDAKHWATMPVPGGARGAAQDALYEAMPVPDLAALWCRLQALGLKDQTEESWGATLYFDHLPHDAPDRALDMALQVLASDVETRVKMQLGEKFMAALVYNHAGRLIDRIEAEAAGNARLRWLLGAVHWWAPSRDLKARLARIADEAAWRADESLRDTPPVRIDYASLSVDALARAWVEQHGRPEKDRDANWHALADFERRLLDRDPDRALDLVVAVLAIETDPNLLSLLAAGLLEDLIGPETIARVEREASNNPAFRALLGGVWYHNETEDLRARLDAIVNAAA